MSSGVEFRVESNAPAALAKVEQQLERASARIAIAWHAAARQAAPVDLGRLRASIAFATHEMRKRHSASYPGKGNEPGGTVEYTPPDPGKLTAAVGSNVEYALAVHEGVRAHTETVRAHSRRITKAWGRSITPRTVQVRSFTRMAPSRPPMKFIEGPGRMLLWRFREIVVEELRKLGGDA